MDFSFISDIIAAIDSIKAGSVVGIGGLLTVLIRVYRSIPKAPWPEEKWNWLIVLVTFLVGFLAAMFTGVFGFGLGWGPAVLAALGVAVNAAGFNSVTKTVGQALPPQPVASPFRAAASIVIPLKTKNNDVEK